MSAKHERLMFLSLGFCYPVTAIRQFWNRKVELQLTAACATAASELHPLHVTQLTLTDSSTQTDFPSCSCVEVQVIQFYAEIIAGLAYVPMCHGTGPPLRLVWGALCGWALSALKRGSLA